MFPVGLVLGFTCLLALVDLPVVRGQYGSICQTLEYRALSAEMQNEHQCIVLERLQEDLGTEKQLIKSQFDSLYSMMTNFQDNLFKHLQSMNVPSRDNSKTIPNLHGIPLVRDCNELIQNGVTVSGVYPIRLSDRNIVNVWCDMETSYGGWTTIQRRSDGTVDFAREWDEYGYGFGNPNSEYWLGNENLYRLTTFKDYSVRFDLWDWEGNYAHAQYEEFRVESEQLRFMLKISGYSGTAGDAMSKYHNNMKFSTVDSDNDEWYSSCAKKDQSGWWFRACGFASPNGIYVPNGKAKMTPDGIIRGITWFNWKNDFSYSMKRVEIKIKPRVSVKHDLKLETMKTDEQTIAENGLDNFGKTAEAPTEGEEEMTTFSSTTTAPPTSASTTTTTTTTTTTPTTTIETETVEREPGIHGTGYIDDVYEKK